MPVELAVGMPEPKRARRADRDGWARLATGREGANGASFIRLSLTKDGETDFRGVCGICAATFSRTCKPRPNGQGRPLGLIGAWLMLIQADHDATAHMAFKPDFAQRVQGRSLMSALPGNAHWVNAERLVDDALDDAASGEPLRIP